MKSMQGGRSVGALVSGALLVALAGAGSAFAFGDTVVMGRSDAGAVALRYTPEDKVIYKGETVSFTNQGDRIHSATSGTGPTDAHAGHVFDTEIMAANTGATYTTPPFDEVGVFPYWCKVRTPTGVYPHFNNGMKGKVRVLYRFGGFQAPVEPVVNTAKAGSAIPVKFSLDGYQGMDIFASVAEDPTAPKYPVSQTVGCVSGAATDAIEETATPGASGLSYDAATDTYTYVWKTDKSWAGQCRKLLLRFADGAAAPYEASFQFSR